MITLFQIVFFLLLLIFAFAAIGERDSQRQKSFTEILISIVIVSGILALFGG